MRLAVLLLAATILAPQQTVAPPPSPPFEQWLQELIAEARARGFSDGLIDATLSGITPVQRVVERDSSQAEFTITLDRYFETRVTPRIIRLGRAQLMEQRAVLRNIRTAYGVSPGVVLAIWGMESHYGEFTGTYPVFQALASLANYLKDAGWEPGETWGREVKVSMDARAQVADIPKRDAGCSAKRLMTERRPLPVWRDAGVKLKSGAPLPVSDIPASLIDDGGRSFLVYPNYERILDYNCAHLYALSVAMLADRLQ